MGKREKLWIEKLYDFLGPELFDEFEAEFHCDLNSCYRSFRDSSDYDLVKFCERERESSITNAFDWGKSAKGFDFWSNLHRVRFPKLK